MVAAKEEARQEIMNLTCTTIADPSTKNTMVEEMVYDTQGRLLLGPIGVAHTLQIVHHSIAGHLGIKKLLSKFRENCAAAGDQSLFEEVVRSCHGCQVVLDYRQKPVPPGQIPGDYPCQVLSMNIMDPSSVVGQHCFVITFVDIFSGYCVLVPSAIHTAYTVARALVDWVVTYFGVPARSDCGQEFVRYV